MVAVVPIPTAQATVEVAYTEAKNKASCLGLAALEIEEATIDEEQTGFRKD